jgi:Mycobacterium membrane protein
MAIEAVGAFTVSRPRGVVSSDLYTPDVGNADAIVQFNPMHVLYEIFGPAGTAADMNHLDADGQPQRVDSVTLPWSLVLVATLTAVSANGVAQGDSDTIGCALCESTECSSRCCRLFARALIAPHHWR